MEEKKKKIPCRVCGKLFEPCAYCQDHSDVFRWRNFACSRECAKKYIDETIAYRESLKSKKEEKVETSEKVVKGTVKEDIKKPVFTRKKTSKKSLVNISEDINKEDVSETETE